MLRKGPLAIDILFRFNYGSWTLERGPMQWDLI